VRLYSAMLAMAKLKIIIISLFMMAACDFFDIKKQTDLAGSAGTIMGRVNVESIQAGSVVIVQFKNNHGVLVKLNEVVASLDGGYRFTVLPGEYAFFAFIDVNNDGEFQRDKEHGNYYSNPKLFMVEANQNITLEPLVIKGHPPIPSTEIKIESKAVKISDNIGKVIDLSDARFSRDNYSMGMWRPIDFLEKVGGGLMMLQDYDKNKTPVIFVHGINGGPTDFKQAIDNLDRKHFQPWVLYYPSGFSLNVISDYFLQAVQQQQKHHNFRKFIVIAHSMGGLVTRSFVKKYTQRITAKENDIQLVMTVNSPIGGMTSATTGVKYSPIVVPSWRDISPESKFFKDLFNWNWPSTIPYHLVFSYYDGSGSDGVVALDSQIPAKIQSETTGIYGFNDDHVGTLNNERFISLYKSILEKQIN